MEISSCFHPSCKQVLIMKFCAWHGSCTVVACAKFCSEMIPYYGVTSKPNLENCSWNLRLVTLLAKWLPQSQRSIPRRHELIGHMTPLRNNHMTTWTRGQAQKISNHLRNSWDILYDQKSKISSYAPVFMSLLCVCEVIGIRRIRLRQGQFPEPI